MELEEKNMTPNEEQQSTASRDGYQSTSGNNYQREYRPGRSPRPRIHTSRPSYNSERPAYNRSSADEGGFRPEGFGAGLQSNPRPTYRPRNNYGQQGTGGYRPRTQYGEGAPRPQYGEGAPRTQYGEGAPRPQYGEAGPRSAEGRGQSWGKPQYGRRPQGGYGQRPQSSHYSQSAHYSKRPQYGEGGPRPYDNRNQGWGKPQYGARPQGGYKKRPHTPDYDPNAKYSLKKRIEYKEINYDPNEPVRLNKFLANAGICSRREADEFIQAGVITVNGNVVTELGTKILRTDEVRFHDQPVSLEKKVYVLLNKPKDYVTTSDDPQQRKTVMDLVKNACPERIYPVGRLDRNTTGVLLLTNDGDLASKLTHPKFLKKKIYHVYLDKNVTAHDLTQIAAGIQLEDGEIHADDVQYTDPNDKKQVGIEIHSGKNRIVRRIFEHLGYRVVKLDRVQFAGLTKKNLRRGDWRYLTEEEVDRLRMGAYE